MTISCQDPFKVDLNTFNQLFRDHYPSLRAYAGFLIGDNNAEDIVQDVLLQTWENREAISIHTSVKAYLFKSVYNRCLNSLRNLKVVYGDQYIESRLTAEEMLLSDPDKNHIIQKLFMKDIKDKIDQAIDSLPNKCREVFKLSYLNDYKNKEISQLLGISVSTVEKHINHALNTLRKTLDHIKTLLLNLLLFMITRF